MKPEDIPDEGGCPLLGRCVKHRCPWYTQIIGRHPQTGVETNEWRCAVTLIPIMLVELSRQQYHTGAAVESFRNSVERSNAVFGAVLARDTKLVE